MPVQEVVSGAFRARQTRIRLPVNSLIYQGDVVNSQRSQKSYAFSIGTLPLLATGYIDFELAVAVYHARANDMSAIREKTVYVADTFRCCAHKTQEYPACNCVLHHRDGHATVMTLARGHNVIASARAFLARYTALGYLVGGGGGVWLLALRCIGWVH